MRSAWKWLVLPTLMLGAGVAAEVRSGHGAPRGDRLTDWAAVSDAKLERTFRTAATAEESAALVDDTHRPVGRPGLPVHIRMDADQQRFFRAADKHTPRMQQEVSVAFGSGPERTALLATHGWSTQDTPRKSFSVQLFKRQAFTDSVRVKKFLLLNMLYDKGAFQLETCWRLLGEIGLFPGYHEYVTVWINGVSEGLYLLVERPEDAIRRTAPNTVAVIRRRWFEAAEVKYTAPQLDPLATYRQLMRLAPELRGAGLESRLGALIDLDQYLAWLAFNSLVENADYLDEVFLYQTRDASGRLQPIRITAWDYDDLFKPASHRQAFSDSLLWACEAQLDRRIRDDPALHARFVATLSRLLTERFTQEHLDAVLGDVRRTVDGIDSGLPPSVAAEQKARRDTEIEAFGAHLRRRRDELLRRLSQLEDEAMLHSNDPGQRPKS